MIFSSSHHCEEWWKGVSSVTVQKADLSSGAKKLTAAVTWKRLSEAQLSNSTQMRKYKKKTPLTGMGEGGGKLTHFSTVWTNAFYRWP